MTVRKDKLIRLLDEHSTNMTVSDCVFAVLAVVHPFKVFNIVVLFVQVFVIDDAAEQITFEKMFSDKAVNKEPRLLFVNAQLDSLVTAVVHIRNLFPV